MSCLFHSLLDTPCAGAALGLWAASSDTQKEAAKTLSPEQQFYYIPYWSGSVLDPFHSSPSALMASWSIMNPYVYAVIGRPKRAARLYTRLIAQRAGLTMPYTSMHVRHGDKSVEAGLVPFALFVAELERMPVPRGGGARHRVWIATDNTTVLSVDLALATQRAEFMFNSDTFVTFGKFNASRTDLSQSYYEQALHNRTGFFLQTWADISLLIHADTFIGTRTSGMASLVVQLRPFYEPIPHAHRTLLLCSAFVDGSRDQCG
jgi:hypothetical protein